MSSSLNVVYDDIHKLHFEPYGRHPENPRRLENALSFLRGSGLWSFIKIHNAPEAETRILNRIHSIDYISLIERECRRGFHYVDSDTYVTEHTFNVASRFITAAYNSALKSFEDGNPWIIMPRPGGHHAGRMGWAMGAPTLGFCIFNYAAAASYALLERGFRVLILDFDAHHGNGTQNIFWDEPRVVHIDIHEEGIYPGTGKIWDIGGEGAEGSKINIPLPAYSGDSQYLWTMDNIVKPLISIFKPDAIIVSAGFDAYVGDPLTRLNVTDETYKYIASTFSKLFINGEIKSLVTVLEGGYGDGLIRGFRAYTEGLIKPETYVRVIEPKPPQQFIVEGVKRILKEYWNINH